MDDAALDGLVVAVTAERRSAELGAALARHGAGVIYAPAVRIVPLADDSGLRLATESLVVDRPDVVIATTAVGFRGWLDAASGWGLGAELLEVLRYADVLTRGPKVRGAVRAAGLVETWSPPQESSEAVFAHLTSSYPAAGLRVAVQLHGDPLVALVAAARDRGTDVVAIPVYRWEPPADPQPLRRLLALIAEGPVSGDAASGDGVAGDGVAGIDAVTFTSAPAATNFVHTADELGIGAEVRERLATAVTCFAVGPVTAAPLLAAGVPVLMPDRFRLGALVREIVDQLPGRSRRGDTAAR